MPDIFVFALFFAVGIITLRCIDRKGNMRMFVAYLIIFTAFTAYMIAYAGNSFMIKLIAPMFDGQRWILDSQAATFNDIMPYITLSFAVLILFSLFITVSALWSMFKVIDEVKNRAAKNAGREIKDIKQNINRILLRQCRQKCVLIHRLCRMNC